MKRLETWCLTWDGVNKRTGKPVRRGNRFFTEAEAKRIYQIKADEGRNPSEIEFKVMDFITF